MNNKTNSFNKKLTPVTTYNLDKDKNKFNKDNKGKSGVYRLNNLVRGKCYIGSSVSLGKRFQIYSSSKAMKYNLNLGSSAIYSALLKYGYLNFSLDIMEYCEPNLLIKREQYYIDLLNPKYNILKIAGNRLGSKHSDAAKIKMKVNNIASSPLRKINHLLATGLITTVVNKKNNYIKVYDSTRAAERDLRTSHNSWFNYINTDKLYKGIYIITRKIKN